MTAVERLIRNRLAKDDGEGFVALFEELVSKEGHLDVSLDLEAFAPSGEVIEKLRVVSVDMGGNDVTMVFFRFGNESFFPIKVHDLAAFHLARAQSEREIANGSVASEGLVEQTKVLRPVGNTFSNLVHRDEDRLKVLDKQQEVVDWCDWIGAMVAYRADQGDAVKAAERMVGSHQHTFRGRQVLLTLRDDIQVEILHHSMYEIHTLQITVLAQNGVDILLMQQALNTAEKPIGHPLHQLGCLRFKNLPEIDQITVLVLHRPKNIKNNLQR